VVGGVFGISWGLLTVVRKINILLADFLSVWLISTTLAGRGLLESALKVKNLLVAGWLDQARKELRSLVGRDTESLSKSEAVRATIESVAENLVDAVISPLFYAFIGGAPLALVYRAINTLDSMFGYKNELYRDFGWAAARLDDLANFIPARLSLFLISISSWLCGFNGQAALKIALRDHKAHPSPNSGLPEAAMAGAVGVQLGGLNFYQGKPEFKGYLGDGIRQPKPLVIEDAVRISLVTVYLSVSAGVLISLVFRGIFP
jgi:adenosylcobinamide-phosphate synthase